MGAILKKIEEAFHKVLMLFKPIQTTVEPASNDTYVEVQEPVDKQSLDEKKDFPETFGELLEKIETTFDSYLEKSFKHSWLDRDEQLGLKKLGAYVPNPWQILWIKDNNKITVNETKTYPSMMFISLQISKALNATDEYIYPDFMFGIKINKLPWGVENVKGVPYKFGYAYKDKKFNKLFWAYSWIVIDENRKIHICKEQRMQSVVIKNGHNKGRGYERKIWQNAKLLEGLIADYTKYMAENSIMNSFAGMFNWWLGRNDRWNVSVKHNGDRLTFSVDKSLTKKYFADRDKSIKTPSGKTKRIIHYVSEFKRVVRGKEQTVKEHIRGLDRFNWKGYECFVKAPEFSSLTSVDFDVASLEVDDDGQVDQFISTSKLGLILAEKEDTSQRVYH